jgi:sodium/proline symporter
MRYIQRYFFNLIQSEELAMNLSLCGFGLYFVVVGLIAAISYLTTRKNSGSYGQVMLGNRSVNYILTALSAHASDMSDWIFMAFPAYLYANGLVSFWIAVGLVVGMWVTWNYVAPQLRKATEQYDALTLSGYFEARFSDTSGFLRALVAIICFFFFAIYIAAGLKGFGYLGESLFAIPYAYGVTLAIVAMMAYIMFGGYRALAWIDAFQAIFLLSVIVIVPFLAFFKVGGLTAIYQAAAEHKIELSFIPGTWLGLLNALLLAISWGVGYCGMPHIITKFMGISDVNQMKKAQYIGLSWQTIVFAASGSIGIVGIAYFPTMLANKELVFLEMVKDMFAPFTAGIILSAVAGAALSAVAAQVLVLISVIVEDLYHKSFRLQASDRELVWVYRVGILVIGLLSMVVSLDRSTTIQQLVQYAWMGFGCSFGPLVLLSLHSTTINRYGAGAGIIVGGAVAAVWNILGQAHFLALTGVDMPAAIPGFAMSMIAILVVSYLTSSKKIKS